MNGQVLKTTIATALVFACSLSYNVVLVPVYRFYFEPTADLATAAGMAVLATVAALSYFRPQAIRSLWCQGAALACLVLGAFGIGVGIVLGEAFLVAFGGIAFHVALEFVDLFAFFACCQLSDRSRNACIVGSLALGFCLSWSLSVIDPYAAALGCVGFACVSFAASREGAQSLLAIVNVHEPIAVTKIASPKAMLPFSHTLFVAAFLLYAMFGYSSLAPQDYFTSPWGFAFAGALCLWCFRVQRTRALRLDSLFRIVLFVALAGVVATALAGELYETIASPLFTIMNCGCYAFLWLALSGIASRNKATAPAVFAWGLGLSEIGIVMGANLAFFVSASSEARVVASFAVMLVLTAFVLFGVRSLNVDDAVNGVRAPVAAMGVDALDAHAEGEGRFAGGTSALVQAAAERDFEARCRDVADRFALTPREQEIVGLLARGRNGVRIQEMLVISRNTYKTHIRHIYDKMGVRDQQDVIDLVNEADPD